MALVTANIAVFLLTTISPQLGGLLALVPAAVFVRPWTVVTYMFVHAGVMHLLLNMIGLYFFGPRMEDRLGARDFLVLYFLSGIAGAALTFLLAPYGAVVGASGAVMGILAGYAHYWPDDRIYIWGVLPVSARVMVIGLAAYSIYSGFSGRGGGVAHFAHLGGLAVGWLYVLWRERRRKAARSPSMPREKPADARAHVERWERIRPAELHEVNRAEAQRLLAKLRTQGPRSLSRTEREFLDRFAPP